MKERPLLFSGSMVRAILEGRKTQTRRVVKPQPRDIGGGVVQLVRGRSFSNSEKGGVFPRWAMESRELSLCPYGQPGDRLWVRETWRTEELAEGEDGEIPAGTDGVRFQADGAFQPIENTREASERWVDAHRADGGRTLVRPWRPSIHMPSWASRLTLEVTGVRVERLRDISNADGRAEGYTSAMEFLCGDWAAPLRASNPWVWVVEFRPLAADERRSAHG